MVVMNPVRSHPGDRPAFESHRFANRENVLKRLEYYKRAVRVPAMVSQTDAPTRADPIQNDGNREYLPTEKEEGRDRSYMQKRHDQRCRPIHSMARYGGNISGH